MTSVVVFRADASLEMGGGHIYRCLTLADALAEVGWRCIFACRRGTLDVTKALGRSNHEIIELEPTGEQDQLRQIKPEGIDLLVVDHYGLDDQFETACRPWGRRILAVDDAPSRRHDCDILLDQNLAAQSSSYRAFAPDHCRMLMGPRYALLRPQFHDARQEALSRRVVSGKSQRLLISLGATDPSNFTSQILVAAKGLSLKIDVVIGSNSAYVHSLHELIARFGLNAEIHIDVINMAELMSAADFAVGAGGSTSWERCCLGLPSLIVTLAENQRSIAESLDKAGAAICLDITDAMFNQKLTTALNVLYQDEALRSAMAQKAAEICDGTGVKRVVVALANG